MYLWRPSFSGIWKTQRYSIDEHSSNRWHMWRSDLSSFQIVEMFVVGNMNYSNTALDFLAATFFSPCGKMIRVSFGLISTFSKSEIWKNVTYQWSSHFNDLDELLLRYLKYTETLRKIDECLSKVSITHMKVIKNHF